MGHTTSISDYELSRGDGPPPCEGYDVEAEAPAEKGAKSKAAKPKAAEPEPEEEVYLEDLTVPELKEELDARGVEYPANARKAELIELIEQAQ
jgi:hypothetical protein